MEIIDEKTIKLERELNDLDAFVLDFIKVLQKHTRYVLISGYVALLFGRTRNTEDVDLFIEKLSRDKFSSLYRDLKETGFYALNAESEEELFSLLEDKLSVRFARIDAPVPNMEIKFVKDILDQFTLHERIKVITAQGELYIGDMGLQIAYKRFILKSPKDLEDARHLQKLFSLSEEKIDKYQRILKEHGRS
ncbi:MAG TPA: hypothetical protein VJG31_00410 [Candidatus Nanoarchaeia archaeon]|nr:hypothetical protein [Candidatus Nanoarchaeia archaeon]